MGCDIVTIVTLASQRAEGPLRLREPAEGRRAEREGYYRFMCVCVSESLDKSRALVSQRDPYEKELF